MGKVTNRRSENTSLIMNRCRMGAKLRRKIGRENPGLSSPHGTERRESSSSVLSTVLVQLKILAREISCEHISPRRS